MLVWDNLIPYLDFNFLSLVPFVPVNPKHPVYFTKGKTGSLKHLSEIFKRKMRRV